VRQSSCSLSTCDDETKNLDQSIVLTAIHGLIQEVLGAAITSADMVDSCLPLCRNQP
jgi:hypothetical protein